MVLNLRNIILTVVGSISFLTAAQNLSAMETRHNVGAGVGYRLEFQG